MISIYGILFVIFSILLIFSNRFLYISYEFYEWILIQSVRRLSFDLPDTTNPVISVSHFWSIGISCHQFFENIWNHFRLNIRVKYFQRGFSKSVVSATNTGGKIIALKKMKRRWKNVCWTTTCNDLCWSRHIGFWRVNFITNIYP